MDFIDVLVKLCDVIIFELCDFLCKLVCEFGFMCVMLVDSDWVLLVVYVIFEIGMVFGINVKDLGVILWFDKLNMSW